MPKGIYKRKPSIKYGMSGKHHSEETKKKISKIAKEKNFGRWIKGKHTSPKTEFKKGQKNKKHPAWKGNDVGERAIHQYIEKYKPKPKFCEICGKEKDHLGKTKLELANIKNHNYTRNPDDYRWSHISCHRKYDGIKPNNLARENAIKMKKLKC